MSDVWNKFKAILSSVIACSCTKAAWITCYGGGWLWHLGDTREKIFFPYTSINLSISNESPWICDSYVFHPGDKGNMSACSGGGSIQHRLHMIEATITTTWPSPDPSVPFHLVDLPSSVKLFLPPLWTRILPSCGGSPEAHGYKHFWTDIYLSSTSIYQSMCCIICTTSATQVLQLYGQTGLDNNFLCRGQGIFFLLSLNSWKLQQILDSGSSLFISFLWRQLIKHKLTWAKEETHPFKTSLEITPKSSGEQTWAKGVWGIKWWMMLFSSKWKYVGQATNWNDRHTC